MPLRKEEGVKCTEAWRLVKDLDARVGGFDGRAADSSDVRVVFLLRALAIAMPSARPRSVKTRLRTRRRKVGRASVRNVLVASKARAG